MRCALEALQTRTSVSACEQPGHPDIPLHPDTHAWRQGTVLQKIPWLTSMLPLRTWLASMFSRQLVQPCKGQAWLRSMKPAML